MALADPLEHIQWPWQMLPTATQMRSGCGAACIIRPVCQHADVVLLPDHRFPFWQEEAAAAAKVRATGRRSRAARRARSGGGGSEGGAAASDGDAARQTCLEEALLQQMEMQKRLHEQLEVRRPTIRRPAHACTPGGAWRTYVWALVACRLCAPAPALSRRRRIQLLHSAIRAKSATSCQGAVC